MTPGDRPSGIDVIGDVPWGTHFCIFYDTSDDQSDIIIPFFEAGLQNNEFCMCVTSDVANVGRMKELMRAKFPNFDDLLKMGQVEVIPCSEWYLIDGVFDHRRVLDGWNEKLRKAQARGFEGARLTGDTFWVDKPIWNDFIEYERAIDGAIEGRNIIVLCTYPLVRCDAGDILDVVSTHQSALARREGEWKLIENTELKVTQEALRESVEKFRALTESSPAMVFFHQGGKHLYVNPAAEVITGYSSDELLGMDFWMLAAPEYRDEVKARGLARLRGEKSDSGYPVRIVTKQGLEKWLEVWTALMEYLDGPAVMVTALDVTERKRAERALKSSEEKYRELVENANSIIIRWDTQGKLTFFNEYAEKLFDYTEDEVLGRNVVGTIVPPSGSTGCDLAALMVDIERYPERYELNVNENMRKNGERVWIAWTNKAILDKQGNLVEILSVGNDITERKLAEKALIRERFILTKSQEIAHVGNWSLDLLSGEFKGSIENYRIYGYEPGEVKPTLEWILSRVHPEDRPELDDFMEANVRDGKLGSIDFRIIRPDGPVRYVNTIVDKAVRDKAGRIKRLYGISQDVTERKQAEVELKAAKQQAELYLDVMGHDINNIHQAALGYLELARDMPCDAREEYIDKAMEALHRSTQLISNVRKLQKLQDNRIQAHDVDACAVLAEVYKEFVITPDKTITLNLNGNKHCHVWADDLLHDVFSNLAGNAMKHTGDHAHVSINLDTLREDGREYCRVRIDDDGPGIPDGSKKTLFNRSLKGTPRAKGMGLGLYIVKTLVENYGGHVWAEDRVQGDSAKGARFVVILPAIEK